MVAGAHGPQEVVHGTVADLAAVLDSFSDRLAEVESVQDA
jgi:hypothetical protein